MKAIKVSIVLTAIFGLALFSSCKKCMECHYEKGSEDLELGEYCGDDVEDLESNGYTVNDTTYDVHCGGH